MRTSLIIALAALALAPVTVQARPAPLAAAVAPATATNALTLGRRVADWQLAHMDSFDYTHFHRYTADPRGWIQGALFVGLSAFAERSGDPRYAQAVRDHGAAQGWGLGHRPLHADDHVIGQAWLWA